MTNQIQTDRFQNIGLLGGSFNPLHLGHLRLCAEAIEQAGLDQIQLIPAHIPPHKELRHILPFEMRCAMMEASLGGISRIRVNKLEKDRPGPSYTYDTLQGVVRDHPEADFSFIMGDNDLLTMPKWHNGKQIAFQCDLIVAGRQGCGVKKLDQFITSFWDAQRLEKNQWVVSRGKKIRYIVIPKMEISSSMVRSRWLEGRIIDWLVPEPVKVFLNLYSSEVKKFWGRSAY
ncbi:nicotinate (nicotinamide) nucleotide adenylyltransferase [Desulfonatronovibrio hydrogenovorans]|uniref:nicotinate (nicotinamide) nucleotide adenylyltransferase n=1 Tax=Desulfonatronovibrio hydrogenovorans TaxID=53245 RepID=UPI00137693A1|nr:nicotinate (nicotinamide) nucleotide adenylyltransferase [Desulfonatronovibrio hydrogenovorans]